MSEARPAEGLDPDADWSRLHPLTPLLRGGRYLLVLVVLVGQAGLRDGSVATLAVLLAVGFPVALLAGYLSWRAMRYRLTATELQVDSGILTKRSRRVPLARVQAVDVVRPFYARVLGLAELRLEVVGAGDAEAPLSFLEEQQAGVLRTRMLDLAAGRTAASEDGHPPLATADRVLVQVPTRVLVWSTLLGAPALMVLCVLLAVGVAALVDLRVAGTLLVAAGAPLFGVASLAVRRLLSEYGFSVAESPDGLRLRHGLLDTRSQTIPQGRVQLVRIREPLLWRPFGWVRVEVDVAGYSGGGEEQAATGALLPVAPRQLAEALVARVLGGPLPAADRPAPRGARWRAPLAAPRLRGGVDDRHVVTSYGIVTTTTDIAPLAKVQSLRLTQGPWQRRLRLASLHADTAGRRLPTATMLHRSAPEAAQLLEELSVRARAARQTGR